MSYIFNLGVWSLENVDFSFKPVRKVLYNKSIIT